MLDVSRAKYQGSCTACWNLYHIQQIHIAAIVVIMVQRMTHVHNVCTLSPYIRNATHQILCIALFYALEIWHLSRNTDWDCEFHLSTQAWVLTSTKSNSRDVLIHQSFAWVGFRARHQSIGVLREWRCPLTSIQHESLALTSNSVLHPTTQRKGLPSSGHCLLAEAKTHHAGPRSQETYKHSKLHSLSIKSSQVTYCGTKT